MRGYVAHGCRCTGFADLIERKLAAAIMSLPAESGVEFCFLSGAVKERKTQEERNNAGRILEKQLGHLPGARPATVQNGLGSDKGYSTAGL